MPTPKRPGQWAIPNDWTEGDGYAAVLFCFPASLMWKTTVTGMVSQLLLGRSWDSKTGSIIDVQQVGREVFETMSIICIEDLANIATAINNLTLAIETQGPNISGCGCGYPGKDSIVAPPPAQGGGPAPPGYTNLPPIDQIKCNAANVILDDIEEILQLFLDGGIETLTWGTILTWESMIWIVLAEAAAGPIAWGLTIMAGISSLVTILLARSWDLQRILDAIQANREALQCIIYSANGSTEAWDDLQTALVGYGLQPGDILFIEGLQWVHALSVAWYVADDAYGQALQAYIEGYEGADCSNCVAPVSIKFMLGINNQPRGTGDLTPGTGPRVLSSAVDSNGFHYLSFGVYANPSQDSYYGTCAPLPPGVQGTPLENFCCEFSAINGPSSQSSGQVCIDGVNSGVWGAGNPALDIDYKITWCELISVTTPFTVTVILNDDGC